MKNHNISIGLLQFNVAWEQKAINLATIERLISEMKTPADIIVLPEMCTTGFTFNVDAFAETIEGNSVEEFRRISKKYNLALCGSFLCQEEDQIFNRGFFITQEEDHFFDKRHLFRMGRENELFSAGKSRKIISYKGVNICPLICYDLRFPVWSKNIANEYDLLIYAGNWPKVRRNVWETLLKARSIENMCYTIGVNRIGVDGNNIVYAGESLAVDPRGETIYQMSETEEKIVTVTLDMERLLNDREKFPVWKDADSFEIKI